MRRRGGGGSIAANPVLIGAVTVLVVIVAVYLAYNANSGLPFVPTYDLKAEVPNAAGLVKGNDVRVGGTRVGTVSCIEPQTQPSGEVIAVLCLKLETVVKPLPADTRVTIRPRSALGLKYVQLTRGDSDGGPRGELDDPAAPGAARARRARRVLRHVRRSARAAPSRATSRTSAPASPARGADLNFTIRDLNPLLDDLEPVMRNLASAETDLKGFWDGLAQSAAVVAPVAEVQARDVREPRHDVQRARGRRRPVHPGDDRRRPADAAHGDPHPADHPAVPRQLGGARSPRSSPGFENFAAASPDLANAVRVGTPALEDSPEFNARLATTFKALETFSTDPQVRLGFQDLTSTVSIAGPLISEITPSQTSCNYIGLFFKNLSSALSEGGTNGQTLRVAIIAAPGGQPVPNQPNIDNTLLAPNNEGSPSSAPANGPSGPGYDTSNYLHSNPFPFTAAPSQPKSCEAANEKFLPGRLVIGNVPGQTPTTLHYDSKLTPSEQRAREKGGALP